MALTAIPTTTVIPDLIRDPSCLPALSEQVEKWILKQVQDDDKGKGLRW